MSTINRNISFKFKLFVEFEEEKIFEWTKNYYLYGWSLEETFWKICHRVGIYFIKDLNVRKDFMEDFMIKGPKLNSEFEEIYTELRTKINEYFQLFKKAIFISNKYFGYNMNCENPRYGLRHVIKNNQLDSFILFDYFHEETRNLPIVGKMFNFCTFKIYQISIDRILFYNQNSQRHDLYLLELDFKNNQCKKLDQKAVWPEKFELAFDLNDRNRFLFITEERGIQNYIGYMAHLTKNQIDFNRDNYEKKFEIRRNFYFQETSNNSFILIDNKLCFLTRYTYIEDEDFDNTVINLRYNEIDLTKRLEDEHFSINIDGGNVLIDPNFKNFVWGPSKVCYANLREANSVFSSIYAIDISVQKCQKIEMKFRLQHDLMIIDNEDVLLTQDENAVYRYPLRRPDPLQHLTWFKIRQLTFSSKNKTIYSNAIKLLPLNSEYKPFYF